VRTAQRRKGIVTGSDFLAKTRIVTLELDERDGISVIGMVRKPVNQEPMEFRAVLAKSSVQELLRTTRIVRGVTVRAHDNPSGCGVARSKAIACGVDTITSTLPSGTGGSCESTAASSCRGGMMLEHKNASSSDLGSMRAKPRSPAAGAM
jgi:hypothetical protein